MLSLREWLGKGVGKEHITMFWCAGSLPDVAGVWRQKDWQGSGRQGQLPEFSLVLSQVFPPKICALSSVPTLSSLETSHAVLQGSHAVSSVLGDSPLFS